MNVSFRPKAALKPGLVAVRVHPIAQGSADGEWASPAGVDGILRTAAVQARFAAKAAQLFETTIADGDQPLRLVLLGLGKADDAARGGNLERAGGAITARFLCSGIESIAIDLSDSALSPQDGTRLLQAMWLRGWRHDSYRTRLADDKRPTLQEIIVISDDAALETAWADALAVAQGVAFTRDLVSEPANVIYPESFVARCKALAKLGVEITVLGEKEMKALGMGALLGVGLGSARESQLLAMRWKGDGKADSTPLVLVGKGVTFDTGGISIKPAAGMEDMKWDMGGAGAVAGTMMALAKRKSKAHVVGICGLVENMPDGKAQRPGDIVTSMSGQTIEVINTDAEGRLVLCDALTWAQKEFKPTTIIDLATLTGAIITSLGNEHAGMFTNDDALAGRLSEAGLASGDKLWRFPLGPAYDRLIDSPIADMKNIGGPRGGSITAAQFLQRFIDKGVEWAHLDIAGMVWADAAGATHEKGATGFGVRLLDQFIRAHYEG